jgi:hypothetical protein
MPRLFAAIFGPVHHACPFMGSSFPQDSNTTYLLLSAPLIDPRHWMTRLQTYSIDSPRKNPNRSRFRPAGAVEQLDLNGIQRWQDRPRASRAVSGVEATRA